jgi:hypothetical protein
MNKQMSGWIFFAGWLMIIVGGIDFFEGLIAVIRKTYYTATPNQIIVFNVTTWGWVTLIWGIILVLAGFGLLAGAGWARWFAIIAGSINLFGQLGWLGYSSYPLWSLTVLFFTFMILYSLIVRWDGVDTYDG